MLNKIANFSFWASPSGHHAFILSVISLLTTLIAAVVGILGAHRLDNSLLLVYGLENCVDFFSSAIVLWRFYLPRSAEEAEEARLLGREKRASVAISIVLSVLGFGTIVTSSEDFITGQKRIEDTEVLNLLAWINILSIVIFGTFAFIKFHYAYKLNSSSLKKDGICSFLGAVLSFSMFVNTMLMKADGAMWWLNPFIALCCGIGALFYGFHGIYKSYVIDGQPLCSPRWWLAGSVKSSSTCADLELANVDPEGNRNKFNEDNIDEVALT